MSIALNLKFLVSRLLETNDCCFSNGEIVDVLVSCSNLLHFAGTKAPDPLRFSKHTHKRGTWTTYNFGARKATKGGHRRAYWCRWCNYPLKISLSHDYSEGWPCSCFSVHSGC